MKRLRFYRDLNYQRFLQSPYSAHLNFKTFHNIFDVEICGEKEVNGRVVYKLKRINHKNRSPDKNRLLFSSSSMQNEPDPSDVALQRHY